MCAKKASSKIWREGKKKGKWSWGGVPFITEKSLKAQHEVMVACFFMSGLWNDFRWNTKTETI